MKFAVLVLLAVLLAGCATSPPVDRRGRNPDSICRLDRCTEIIFIVED